MAKKLFLIVYWATLQFGVIWGQEYVQNYRLI